MENFKSFIFLFAFILISPFNFCQLDSVYFKGPSQGSVAGGTTQSTDNISDFFSVSEDQAEIPFLNRNSTLTKDLIFGWNKSRFPDYRYIEDRTVTEKIISGGGQTVLLNSFPGISMTNFIPPDPTIAVGPEHIIICANSTFKILDKSGIVLKSISAALWWAPVWPDENGDPQVIFDHYANRWVLVWMQVNSGLQTAGNLIAYSDDSNPLGLWYMYRLDTKIHGTIPSNTWGDYPKIGYDEEAIYIMTRCIDFAGAGHLYNKIRIINKTELYSANTGPLTYKDIWDIRTPGQGISGAVLDCINPGISYTPGNGGWFFWAMGIYGGSPVSADFYALYKIYNPLTSPTIRGKVLPVQTYTSPPLANQLGGGTGIETIGWITKGPVIRDGMLHVAHDIQNSIHPSYSSVKYLKVDLSSLSIIDNIEYGSEGYFYLFPAITIDQQQNAAITFSRSADNEYIGAYYSTKHSNQTEFSPSKPIAEGKGNYVLTYGSGINRWGDYFGIYLDPANDYDIWMISEYAAATNIWSTYVGQVRMEPYSGAHVFLNPLSLNFGDVEIGTISSNLSTTIANYGDADLIISDIPLSMNDFNLETNLQFPIILSSYDSLTLEFSYSPSAVGIVSTLYEITTNDPNFNGISLTGNCYQILPALEKTVYASSGTQNGGNIISINPATGEGQLIGSSLFSEVEGIAVNPINGIVYGLVSTAGQSNLIRVNADSGDGYTLYQLNVPSPSDIAFDTLGILHVIGVNGELYSIDLSTGETTFIVDAIGSYSGITFHPQTNELWVTSRSFTPPNKDAVFKVNLMTGDTIIVGHTGLDKLTNDLFFDENNNLYGIIGSSSELNDLININPFTGEGNIIGTIGMKHILSLTYVDEILSDIPDEKNNIPDRYSLHQNYPNPFNPSTTINFQISSTAFVSLKVYDALGREVAVLLHEELRPGIYEKQFNAGNLSSGIYFYRMVAGNFNETIKMVLIK